MKQDFLFDKVQTNLSPTFFLEKKKKKNYNKPM